MEKVRGFEIAKGFEGKGINLPERKTKNSAAYDIEAAEDIVIPSFKKGMKPTLVATGLKAYMQEDEVLYLYAKSSGFPKKGIMLSNNVGIIDGDYYENEFCKKSNSTCNVRFVCCFDGRLRKFCIYRKESRSNIRRGSGRSEDWCTDRNNR